MQLREYRNIRDRHLVVENKILAGIDLVEGTEMRSPIRLGLLFRFRSVGTAHRVIGVNQDFIGPIFYRQTKTLVVGSLRINAVLRIILLQSGRDYSRVDDTLTVVIKRRH